jgi:hypothetical protein
MRNVLIALLGVTLLSCFAVATSNAATLESIQGQVMINTGSGYRFVSGTVELKAGDMVVANDGGAALLFYGDGCSVPVQAGTVVTVSEQSPCATTPQQGSTGVQGLTPSTLAIGAVVVGGGVGAALLLGGGGSDKAASP